MSKRLLQNKQLFLGTEKTITQAHPGLTAGAKGQNFSLESSFLYPQRTVASGDSRAELRIRRRFIRVLSSPAPSLVTEVEGTFNRRLVV
jgi:hypothetical protein